MSKIKAGTYKGKGRGDSYGTWRDGRQVSAEHIAGRKIERLVPKNG